MTAWITLSKKFLAKKSYYERFFCFIFNKFWFISIIYIRSILFEFFFLLLFLFFVQVSYTIISFTWWIFRSWVFSLVSPSYSTLCRNDGGVSLGISFSTSVIVSSFTLFVRSTGSWIGCFLIIELSEVSSFIFARNTNNIWRYNC